MNGSTESNKAGSGEVTVLGAIAIILGILAMLAPGITGFSITMLLGILVLIGGVVRIIWAFQASSLGKGLFVFAIGLLTLLAGVALLANPLFASGVLTILLAAYFILDGISEIGAGLRLRAKAGTGWLFFGGTLSVLLGILLWSQFPLAGMWAMGVLLGIKLFLVALLMLTAGRAERQSHYMRATPA
jgi:uncharacterized membrane protein HdeD (DUF308 family)